MKSSFIAGGAVLLVSTLQGCAGLNVFPGGASGCATSNGVCKVDIGVPAGCTTGACVTIAPQVHVGDGTGTVKDVNLLWHLPQGYAFCDGDGIAFKQGPGTQFFDSYATDDPNGAAPTGTGKKRMFHWKDKNTARGTFEYGFRFHDDGCATLFSQDPVVINDM